MPGFYGSGEYDLAGFCVGIVDRSQLLDGSQVQVGDVAIGLASQGVHSNGFSLVRKIVSDRGFTWQDTPPLLKGRSLGEVLLTPTQIYVKPVLAARKVGLKLRGMAHITGGGLPENLPRCLGQGQAIQVDPTTWLVPPIFDWLALEGVVPLREMYQTFNMGVGFVLLVPPAQADRTIQWFTGQGIASWAIGEVITGNGEFVGLLE
jgi:phosphoribosylformylglycinamidine cyclo-ligase